MSGFSFNLIPDISNELDKILSNEILSNEILSNNFDFKEFKPKEFDQRISTYMCGLDKVIPWDKSNFVFSGGLLYDAVIERKECLDTLADIDLFFYGTSEYKLDSFRQLLTNLDSYNYKYLIGINRSVVYIFIQGIPRIIQLIFTNKMSPNEIINSFDLTHIQSYWDGKKFYSKPITISQFASRKTEANFKVKPSRLIKYLRRGIDTTKLLYSDYDFVLDFKQFLNLHKYQKQIEFYNKTNNLSNKINPLTNQIENFLSNLEEFELELSIIFWCKIITKNKLDWVKKNSNNIDEHNQIDFVGDIQNYTKLDTEGEFEQKPYELDLYDDTFEYKKQGYLNRITYSTQKNIYIPCQIIKKSNKFKPLFYLEITKPRVIDYLIGLSDDLEQELFNYTNPTNKPDIQYRFTHHFQNSTSYPKIKSDNNFTFNTFGLIYKCEIAEDKYELYSQGDNLHILFNISIYSMLNIGQEPMFGWKLKPYLIEKN
jgi:hypothetical protein